ncbi:hypothetical protein VTK56DRAFT_1322 [Thermocarpiscus australiensis]
MSLYQNTPPFASNPAISNNCAGQTGQLSNQDLMKLNQNTSNQNLSSASIVDTSDLDINLDRDTLEALSAAIELNKSLQSGGDFEFNFNNSDYGYSLSPSQLSSQSPLSKQSDVGPSPLLADNIDLMQTETSMRNGQLTPRSVSRFSHDRQPSRSSVGSNGPASPFSHNIANPQIAVGDAAGDSFHGMSGIEDFNYQLAPKSFPAVTQGNFYTPLSTYGSADVSGLPAYTYPYMLPTSQSGGNDRGLLQPSEHTIGSSRSRPVSVASSISSDQPVPSNTSGNELFLQRLRAANAVARQSPASAASREQSPFRRGSPLAPMPMHDFTSTGGPQQSAQMGFGTAREMRERDKAMRDAQAMQQRVETSTPQTISPKDAMLEFHSPEGDANFPLFPQQNAPVPPQFQFMTQPWQQNVVPSRTNGSAATTRVSSADTAATGSGHSTTSHRPADTSADGGTYTCTYHGCTQRFDTPAELQKHKREGHRAAQGLGGGRRPGVAPGAPPATGLLGTQAGPHRCERINPSTGKPCNTNFSRPYDLTRHEHTIHNAHKQKVRCDLCTEERTFSRADALTRHYRVCHPDAEFPGKQRRRGGHAEVR